VIWLRCDDELPMISTMLYDVQSVPTPKRGEGGTPTQAPAVITYLAGRVCLNELMLITVCEKGSR
jgi:hypothetical protein